MVVSDELKKALVSRKNSVAMVMIASVDMIEPRFVPLQAANRVRGARGDEALAVKMKWRRYRQDRARANSLEKVHRDLPVHVEGR